MQGQPYLDSCRRQENHLDVSIQYKIIKDILENNRGVWEFVVAFGVEGVDKRGRTNACIKFPKEDTCIMVYMISTKTPSIVPMKSISVNDDDDGTLQVGDVVAVLAPEENRVVDLLKRV